MDYQRKDVENCLERLRRNVHFVREALAEGPVRWVSSQGTSAEVLWARSALRPVADSRLALRTLERPDLAELLFPDERAEVKAIQVEVDQQWAAYLDHGGPVLPGDMPPLE